MPTSFETLSQVLRWWPLPDGISWQTTFRGCICTVTRAADGDPAYYPTIVRGDELWLRAPEGFNTLKGAQAWCLDKLAGL